MAMGSNTGKAMASMRLTIPAGRWICQVLTSCGKGAPSPFSGLATPACRRPTMTQTSNKFFDEIARVMNDAAGAAQGVKREVETVVRGQAERILRDLDLVKREEFDAVKDMARLAREENEALKA